MVNQSFSRGTDAPAINASLVPGYLWENQVIPSSYGLHIGSAALGPLLSLWIGGYDQSRVLGSISSQSFVTELNAIAIDLVDIGIEVDHGGSPWPCTERGNTSMEGNYFMLNALSAPMDPAAPYLNLSESTCAAIARDLPVTFVAKYGLYL